MSLKVTVPPPREIEVTIGRNVSGTIAIPHSVDAENPYAAGFAPATHKIALILHGQAGHRNYCYQKFLAHRLAADLGIYSLRIDFRGCGKSGPNEYDERGRVLEQDMEDIQAAAEFVTDASKNPLKIPFTLSSIIGHSRGSVAMFEWAILQDSFAKSTDSHKAIIVPNLVNCSGRFDSKTVHDRFPKDLDFTSVLQTKTYNGEVRSVFPIVERDSLAKPDLTRVQDLSTDWSVLTIFGLNDTIIRVTDCANWANYLNRGPYSHTLQVVPDADHNFYGTVEIETELDNEEHNPHNYPINHRKLVNYNFHVTDLIINFLKPEEELKRFAFSSVDVGSLPRWKAVEGVNNFRDIGGWHIQSPRYILDTPGQAYYVKPHTLFRCANMSDITENGLKTLNRLGIKTIFDLRSDGECEKAGIPKNLEKYGVSRIHAPVYRQDDYSPQSIAMRYSNLMTSWFTYVNVYEGMLENGILAFKTIFEYIRDDNRPFVFHCTAGKDRTGMVGMLILLLVGVDNHTIGKEYELTTIGLKSEHPVLKRSFMETVEKFKEKLGGESSDLEELISQGRKDWTVEEDGFQNLISSRYEAMLATIAMFNEKYGSIVDYMKNELSFSEDDILKIYKNLVIVDENFSYQSSLEWKHRSSLKPKF